MERSTPLIDPYCSPQKGFFGAIQKLRNVQRGEGFDDFVTYHYEYFEGEGGVIYDIVT